MTSLLPTALSFEDLLRALQGPWSGDGNSIGQLAQRTGRDKSNLRRDLGKLVELGRAKGDSASGWTLGEHGMPMLNAIDRANGAGAPVAGLPLWPLDAIEYNPDNPRKSVAQEALEGLADTIAEAGGLLQPIVLYPAGANGVRMLHAGERRVRACRLLQAEGRLPPALQAGLPFIEREASKAEALFIGLVENSQRENLSPFEDAQALKAFQDETGLSARAIAFKLGRAREGSEEGVRDVQEKIKVMTRCKPEDIAEVQLGRQNFDWLRRRVRKTVADVGQQLRPIDLLILAEVRDCGRRRPKDKGYYGGGGTECSFTAGKDPAVKALVSQGLLAFTEQDYETHKAYMRPGHSAHALFNTEEFDGIDSEEKVAAKVLHRFRVAALGEAEADRLAKANLYATDWLNGPFELSPAATKKIAEKKQTQTELRAANKIKRAAHQARVQEATALVVEVEEQGLTGATVEGLVAQFARSKIAFPLRVSGKNIVDAKDDAVFWNGLGWRFAEDQEALLPLFCAALNAVFAPTPLEAAIAKAPPAQAEAAIERKPQLDREAYTAAVADQLVNEHEWHPYHAAKHAPLAVQSELDRFGIPFGDEDYHWAEGAAWSTADDYAEDHAAPIPAVLMLDSGKVNIPVEHWEDPDAWIAANVRDGRLITPAQPDPQAQEEAHAAA